MIKKLIIQYLQSSGMHRGPRKQKRKLVPSARPSFDGFGINFMKISSVEAKITRAGIFPFSHLNHFSKCQVPIGVEAAPAGVFLESLV